jgi:hypothetical protein
MRTLFENSQNVSREADTKNSRNFCWSRSTFGTTWIAPPFMKFAGAVSSTEESQSRVYRVSMRLQTLLCLKVFCLELKFLHPSLFSLHISTVGSGIKLKHLVPEDSEIMLACSQGDTSRVWNLLQTRRASVNDVTENNHTPLKVT